MNICIFYNKRNKDYEKNIITLGSLTINRLPQRTKPIERRF